MNNALIGSLYQTLADMYRSGPVDNGQVAYIYSRIAAAFAGYDTHTTAGLPEPGDSPQPDAPAWRRWFQKAKRAPK